MLDKIKTRLDTAISNLDIENIEELFPIILDDLEYILEGLAVDEKRLTSTERFMNGVNIAEKELAYFSKLATVYFKKIYNEELEIIINREKVEVPSVTSSIIESKVGNLGYINISIFSAVTYEQFKDQW